MGDVEPHRAVLPLLEAIQGRSIAAAAEVCLPAGALGAARITRLTAELLVLRSKSKLWVTAELAPGGSLDEGALARGGYLADAAVTRARRFTRGDDAFTWLVEEGIDTFEHERLLPLPDPERLAEALASVAPLRPWAPLARPPARLVGLGLGRDEELGLLGLVKIHRDVERLEEDDRALRDAGFLGDPDADTWALASGAASVVFAGGTVVGVLGPVPESGVGWPRGPRHAGT